MILWVCRRGTASKPAWSEPFREACESVSGARLLLGVSDSVVAMTEDRASAQTLGDTLLAVAISTGDTIGIGVDESEISIDVSGADQRAVFSGEAFRGAETRARTAKAGAMNLAPARPNTTAAIAAKPAPALPVRAAAPAVAPLPFVAAPAPAPPMKAVTPATARAPVPAPPPLRAAKAARAEKVTTVVATQPAALLEETAENVIERHERSATPPLAHTAPSSACKEHIADAMSWLAQGNEPAANASARRALTLAPERELVRSAIACAVASANTDPGDALRMTLIALATAKERKDAIGSRIALRTIAYVLDGIGEQDAANAVRERAT